MDIAIMNTSRSGGSREEVAECLAECLSNAVVLYFKAQGHHWNVKGMFFSQFHDFFATVASDVYGSFDGIAENIQKLDVGAYAPFRLSEFAQLTALEDMQVGSDPIAMVSDLATANAVTLSCLYDCFQAATMANCQGIADFIASRIDMHEKWDWQLKSYLTSAKNHGHGLGQCASCAPMCTCPGSQNGRCNCSTNCNCASCKH